MPRGIVPVITLLVIASAFSQFGTSPGPIVFGPSTEQVQSAVLRSAPLKAQKLRTGSSGNRQETEICKDLSPCLPRADLGPWTASCDFFAGPPRSPLVSVDLGRPAGPQLPALAASVSATPSAEEAKAAAAPFERWCVKGGAASGFAILPLIAIIPDPVKSHLVLEFDRRIDAIQAAAIDAGYVMDKFWLPWDDSPMPEDPEKFRGEQILRQMRMGQPGLQIFRSATDAGPSAIPSVGPQPKDSLPRLLFVFLVGETPTLGVNRSQLKNAIDYVAQVDFAAQGPSLSHLVPVVGPSSSGAIPSFIEVLKNDHFWQGDKPPLDAPFFDIVPSTATDAGLLRNLRSSVASFSRVRAIVHDDGTTFSRFQSYAHDYLKVQDPEIALISESETVYGGGILGDMTDTTTAQPQVLHMFFPREIYRLRAAYPDQSPVSAGTSQKAAHAAPGLPLNTKLAPGGEDNIPSFSRDELPQSQEAIMLAITETINRRKIKLVGVAATDIFDTLFVLRFLKQLSPDTRLFVLDSDLLLVRSADDLSLAGTLAITEFPLSSSVRSWFDPSSRLRVFPSRNAEATYNAFLGLIGEQRLLKDYVPCWQTSPSGSPHPCLHPQPLLWLTVVSRNGFQPVRILPPAYDSSGESPPLDFVESPAADPVFKPDRPTTGYLLLCAILIVLSLIQFLSQAFAWRANPDAAGAEGALGDAERPLHSVLEFVYVKEGSAAHDQKTFFLACAFVIVAIIDFIVFLPVVWGTRSWAEAVPSYFLRAALSVLHSTPIWYPLPANLNTTACWYLVLAAVCVVTTLLTVAGALHSTHHYLTIHGNQPFWKKVSLILLMWAAGLSFYLVWFFLTAHFKGTSLLFLNRCLDLSNGTSPLLPYLLLLSALFVWCFRSLHRVHLWDTRRPSLYLPSLDSQFHCAFGALERDLNLFIGDLLFVGRSRTSVLLALLLAGLVMLRPFSHIAGFESFEFWHFKLYDVLFVTFLLLMTTFLLTSLIRFMHCWSALQTILRRLERQPLREAFDRLPKKFYSWTPLWHSLGTRRSFAVETRSLECLRKLTSYPEGRDLLNWELRLSEALSKLLKAESENRIYLETQFRDCQEVLNDAADKIAECLLIPEWQENGVCESLEYQDKKESEKADRGLRYVHANQQPEEDRLMIVAEEFVALRFVSFIRYVGVHLRNLLSLITISFILCVAAVRSYPFLAHRTIGWALTLIFIALGAPVVIAFAQMDKDAILSRLADTEPGKLDRAFYVRVVSYGALPLITVLASQFPAIGRFLFSWVQPAIETLH